MDTHKKAAPAHAGGFHFYRPAAMLLALGLLLVWQGMAWADDFNSWPRDAAKVPDAVHGAGAERIPPGLACTDSMDITPEDDLPSPFDADSVAYRVRPGRAFALPVSTDSGCPDLRPKVDKV